MPRPSITIHDAVTGETITRDMDDTEYAQYEADQEAAVVAVEAAETEAAAKTAARAAAIARFQSLGFTESEIAALVLP